MPDDTARYSVNTFPGDGSTTEREINFVGGYLSPEDVKSFYTTSDGEVIDLSITFVGPSTISTGDFAVPFGAIHTVYRTTSVSSAEAVFTDGTALDENNLDRNQRQALLAVAEIRDHTERALVRPAGEVGYEVGEVAPGQVVANVGGKLVGIANDPAGAAESAAEALAAKVAAEGVLVDAQEVLADTQAVGTNAASSATSAAGAAATSQQARDQSIAASLTAPGRIQNNPATPLVPPAGLANGDRYWAVNTGGKTATLHSQTGAGVGAIVAPNVTVPLKGLVDDVQRVTDAVALKSLIFAQAPATLDDSVMRVLNLAFDQRIVIPDKLVVRGHGRDHFGSGGAERYRLRLAKVTGAGTVEDPYVYTMWAGVGLSNSDANLGGITGKQTVTLLAIDNVTHPGFTNGMPIGAAQVNLAADFGNLGVQFAYPDAAIDVNALKFDPALESRIRAFADQQIVISRATMLRDNATDAFAKKTFGDGIVENGDPLDDYFLNYRFDRLVGAGVGGADLYRARVWMGSTLRGVTEIGYFAKQASGAPPVMPPDLKICGMANGTHLAGDVGIEATIPFTPPTAAEYIFGGTGYTNAVATGIRRSTIRPPQSSREKWTAPAVPAGINEVFIASSGGAQFTSVVAAIAAVTNVDVADIARTTYPAALSYSPARPVVFRIVGPHTETVIPYNYLGVDQSPLRMPHGSGLITRPDTLIQMNAPGSSAPVIEANMTVFFDGAGEIKQFGAGYVIHIDNGNGISGQPTEAWIRRAIVTRLGGVLLHKVPDSNVPIIGSGISDDHDWMADGTRFLFDANTTGASAILIHTSPGCVYPGRIDLRNLTFFGLGTGQHLNVLKTHAQTARHRLCVTNSEVTRIGHGNTLPGTSPIPGFLRGCPLTGVTVAGISLDP